ncbi:hypothetical protein TWF696_003973 [Orbilia brochopaga]|uniref:Blue (type 1) copper domain-containing protein n=1 Tax=Orbilia brochopaga TaxID=3140254 RepID=A0AAV9VB99_9PEZI
MRSIIILTALTAAASAASHTVYINGLTFSVDSLTADVGDTVTWVFAGGNHTVTQSSFAEPCNPLADGFNSGWTGENSESFTITVSTPDPIYYMCAAPGHCKAGMVGIINPPSTGNTLAAFKDAAASADQTSFPGDAFGGIISVQGGAVSTAPGYAAGAAPVATPTGAPFLNSTASNSTGPVEAASVTSVPATLVLGNATVLTVAGPASTGAGGNASATIAVIGPSITGNFTGTLPPPPPAINAAVSLAVGFMTAAICVLGATALLA